MLNNSVQKLLVAITVIALMFFAFSYRPRTREAASPYLGQITGLTISWNIKPDPNSAFPTGLFRPILEANLETDNEGHFKWVTETAYDPANNDGVSVDSFPAGLCPDVTIDPKSGNVSVKVAGVSYDGHLNSLLPDRHGEYQGSVFRYDPEDHFSWDYHITFSRFGLVARPQKANALVADYQKYKFLLLSGDSGNEYYGPVSITNGGMITGTLFNKQANRHFPVTGFVCVDPNTYYDPSAYRVLIYVVMDGLVYSSGNADDDDSFNGQGIVVSHDPRAVFGMDNDTTKYKLDLFESPIDPNE